MLHPIAFDEPFGLSVVEAMACGTPVIAFDRGSMPELIQSGESGFLVNTVTEAVEAVARIDAIDRAYCRRHVEKHFTVERMIRDYTHVYETILTGPPVMKPQNPIVTRFKKNPILTREDVPYPVATVHNAGIVKHDDRYIMLFRSHLRNGRSIIGRADSEDGLSFKVDPQPFLLPANQRCFCRI